MAIPAALTEAELLTQAQTLEPRALGQIHDQYYPELYRFALYRTDDPDLAQDIVSEVFVRLLNALHQKRPPRTTLRGWLFGVAAHLVADHFRRQPRESTLLDETFLAHGSTSEEAEARLQLQAVRRALRQLTSEQQDVLSLRFSNGFSIEETAEALGKSTTAVKALQFRATEALRHALAERRMTDELLNALDDCLSALIAGESLEASLARYPELADELRPMVEAALAAHQLNAEVSVPRVRQNASRAQFLALAAERRTAASRRSGFASWVLGQGRRVTALSLLAAFVLVIYGVASISTQSLPGEALYGIKRIIEQSQLTLTSDPLARAQLQEQLMQRRVNEARAVLAAGRLADVEFGGVIDELEGEHWQVAGISVIVPAGVSLTGVPFPGLFVEVQGRTQADGTVQATAVRVNGLIFRGRVKLISPQAWQVDEQRLWVNAETQFSGDIRLDDEVEVTAWPLNDGLVLALRITRVEPVATPTVMPIVTLTAPPPTTLTPSATPTLPASPTVMPTASPTRTPSPVPSRTSTVVPATAMLTEIEFTGVVEAIGPTVWQIGGQIVLMTSETEINDDPQVGDMVEVRALQDAQGTLTAVRIRLDNRGPSPSNTPPPSSQPESTHTPEPTSGPTNTPEPHETEFSGTVTAINGDQWTIGEHLVTFTGETEYEGNPGVGNFVDVNAWQYWDSTLIARRIRVR